MDLIDKVPHPVDVHVGARLRQLRKTARKSQSELGAAVDLTFQQIQKYELGTNRVSSSKLYAIAKWFGKPIGFFFEGYEDDAETPAAPSAERTVQAFLMTDEGSELALAFQKVRKARHRRTLLDLVRELAEPDRK